MWLKHFMRFKNIIAIVVSIVLFVTPVVAGATTAQQCTEQIKNLKIKELSIADNPQLFSQLSNHEHFKALKNELFSGKYKVFETRMLTIIDPSDNQPVSCMVTPFVKDNKPGLMGIAIKNGVSYAAAILGEDSNKDWVNVSVMTVDDNKQISKQIKTIPKNQNKLASFFISQANAYDAYSFCIDFCNAMCSMGLGFGGCYLLCTGISAGTGALLCGFLCAAFTWSACNWGCPAWCSYIMS